MLDREYTTRPPMSASLARAAIDPANYDRFSPQERVEAFRVLLQKRASEIRPSDSEKNGVA